MKAIIQFLASIIEAIFGVRENPGKPTAQAPQKPKPKEKPFQSVRGDFKHVTADDLRLMLSPPLRPYAEDFADAGHENNLDPRFLAAISMLETGRGTSRAFLEKNNAMGISDKNGPVEMVTVSRSIHRMAQRLDQSDGPYAGADTIPEIGAIYSPPDAGNDIHDTNHGWPAHVTAFYSQFIGLASPTKPPKKLKPASKSKTIRLPRESTTNLNRFYGAANKGGSYTTWFQFPVDDCVLYHRGGIALKDRDGDGRDEHRCHKAIKQQLEAAFQDIYNTIGEERFYAEGWHVYGGCFNYRKKLGGSSLSTHSWAIAIDIHPGKNGWKQYSTTFSDEAMDIMEKHGFISAGRAWGHDYMHFQAAIPKINKGSYYDKYGLPEHIRPA